MKHSNREEMEKYYQRELEKQQAQERSNVFRSQDEEDDQDNKKNQSHSLACSLITLIVLGLALYVIYFVYINIKGPLIDEITRQQDNFTDLSNSVNDAKDGADDLLSQSEEQLSEVGEVMAKVNALREALTNAKNALADLTQKNDPEKTSEEIIEQEEEVKEVITNNNIWPEDYVPFWLYQMRENEKAVNVPEFRCQFLGETIYLSFGGEVGCADCYTDYIYNADGQYRCAASGGLTGKGDGACPGIFADLTDCVVWNGEKWEKTVIK